MKPSSDKMIQLLSAFPKQRATFSDLLRAFAVEELKEARAELENDYIERVTTHCDTALALTNKGILYAADMEYMVLGLAD